MPNKTKSTTKAKEVSAPVPTEPKKEVPRLLQRPPLMISTMPLGIQPPPPKAPSPTEKFTYHIKALTQEGVVNVVGDVAKTRAEIEEIYTNIKRHGVVITSEDKNTCTTFMPSTITKLIVTLTPVVNEAV